MLASTTHSRSYAIDAGLLSLFTCAVFFTHSHDLHYLSPQWLLIPILIGYIAYVLQKNFSRRLLSFPSMHLILGILYFFTLSFFERTLALPEPYFSTCNMILSMSAAFLLLLTFSLQYLLPKAWLSHAAFVLFFAFAFLPPAADWLYLHTFGEPIPEAAILVALGTNPRESFEWLLANFGYAGAIASLAALLFFFFLLYRLHKGAPAVCISPQKKRFISILTLLLLTSWTFLLKDSPHFMKYLGAYTSFSAIKEFHTVHDPIAAKLAFEEEHAIPTVPRTVIVVIGESATRDLMHVYHEEHPYKNTPWLEQMKATPDFALYTNAFASYNLTIEAVPRSLSEQSQYNELGFSDSVNLIDLAKKAGYKTYWLTNQYSDSHGYDPCALIGKTADHFLPIQSGNSYDTALLDFLKEIAPSESNFIFVHLKGSHFYYPQRYPEKAAQWDSATTEGAYANSILYTDKFLQMLHTYAAEHLNLYLMVYYSDHGENLEHFHGPAIHTFDNVRIPLFFYLSPAYQADHPARAATLHAHRNRYVSNDMLYNTIAGLLHLTSNHYDEREDFSSPQYGFADEDVLTFLGAKHAIEGLHQP